MFKCLSLTLAWHFLRSRRYGPLARFMSVSSAAGIAIGTAALIIGLSAMNGFERELEDRVLSVVPAGTVQSGAGGFASLGDDLKALRGSRGITYAEPCVSTEGVLQSGGNFAPAKILGIENGSRAFAALTRFSGVESLPEQGNVIVLGRSIAQRLELRIGDRVTLIAGGAGAAGNLENARTLEYEVAGIFNAGGQLDGLLAFTPLKSALEVSGLKAPNLIELGVTQLLQAPQILYEAALALPERGAMSSWMDTQGKLYGDIQMIRALMYLAMILVMAVACFNIVSNLVMSVAEKSPEIAVLRTMGAPRALIVRVFTLMGLLQGARGALIGTAFGSVIALALTPLMRQAEALFNVKFLNPDVYFIDFIPSKLEPCDVAAVLITALLMSSLSALYPALKSSKVQPARELNS